MPCKFLYLNFNLSAVCDISCVVTKFSTFNFLYITISTLYIDFFLVLQISQLSLYLVLPLKFKVSTFSQNTFTRVQVTDEILWQSKASFTGNVFPFESKHEHRCLRLCQHQTFPVSNYKFTYVYVYTYRIRKINLQGQSSTN